jgi:hypothetical protein
MYEIGVTRIVEYQGTVQVEAVDQNAAHDLAWAQFEAGQVEMEETSDHTELGPIWNLEQDEDPDYPPF